MFGQSVYLSGFDENMQLWEEAEVVFTSFHIAEEFSVDYAARVQSLLSYLKRHKKKVIADISPTGMKSAGYHTLAEFARCSGIDAIRCDYGFTKEEMAEASEYIRLGINASTMDEGQVKSLKETGARLIAIHNFYPRPETGLDGEFLLRKNAWFHQAGIPTAAFISGDQNRRGPLQEGLPTLEKHRNIQSYLQYLELRIKFETDLVLSGDPGISERQRELIAAYEENNIICIPARLEEKYRDLYGRTWTVRIDSPSQIARLVESRKYALPGTKITADHCVERPVGSITMDNEKYLRYSGEIQIIRKNLPACERVNVIGEIEPAYTGLTELLDGGRKIKFIDIGEDEYV